MQPLVCGLNLWLESPFTARELSAVRLVLSVQNLRPILFLSPTATSLIPKLPHHALIKELHIFTDIRPLPRPLPITQIREMVRWEPNQLSKFTALTRLVVSGSLHVNPPSFAAYVQYPPNLTRLTRSRCFGQLSPSRPPRRVRIHTPVLILLRDDSSLHATLSHSATSLVRLHLEYDADWGPMTTAIPFGARIFDGSHSPSAPQLHSLRLIDVGPQLQPGRAPRNIAVRCPGLIHLTLSGHLAVDMLREWGWPEDVAMSFPALEEMAGPAQVVALNGQLVSSTAY